MQFNQLQKKVCGLLQVVSHLWKPASSEDRLTEEVYFKMMELLAPEMKCSAAILKNSYFYFVNKPQTRENIAKLCWHMVANQKSFRAGVGIPYDKPVLMSEILELRISSVKAIEDQAQLKIYILTGPLAAHTKTIRMPMHIADALSYRLGYSFTGDYQPFATLDSIPGLYAKCQLRLPDYLNRELVPKTMDWNSCRLEWLSAKDVITWNRKHIIRYRLGLDPCPCGQDARDREYSYCTLHCSHTWHTCPAAAYDGGSNLSDIAIEESA